MTRPPLVLAAVLALLGAGLAAGEQLPRTEQARAVASVVDVTGTAVVCPDLRETPARTRTRVSVGVPTTATTAEGGDLTGVPLGAKSAPSRLQVERPGQVRTDVGSGLDRAALVVTATGALAAGLDVQQVTVTDEGPDRGMSSVRCQPPAAEAWFVGGATRVGDTTLLLLANPDATPAIVDVTIWTAEGPAEARPGRGISVEGRSRTAVRLDELAPDKDLLAVHVGVQRGRVAAALRHTRVLGQTPTGIDWVPQAQPPATTVVVPGLPKGPGRRVVHVTNPGPDPTVVSLELTTADGQSVPGDLGAVEVPPGTTVATDLTAVTDESATSVRVVSDGGAVLAGGFVHDSVGTSQVKDFAYVASAAPLDGAALLVDTVSRPTSSRLVLTALGAAAVVEVAPVEELRSGPTVPFVARRIDVPAGRTLSLPLSDFLPPQVIDGLLRVQVRPAPGSAPVYISRYLRDNLRRGPMTTLLQLHGSPQRVTLPAVRRDELVGLSR